MIRYAKGDILQAEVEALVNTVNCVGVMGRGIALQFKKAYPDNFKAYATACRLGEFQPGRMFVFDTGKLIWPLLGVTISSLARWARMETGLNFYSHRCRHTVGTQLLQRGVPIDRVQDVLGHADISTTRRYAKTAPEAVLKLAAKLDSLEEERAVYTYVLPEKSVQVSLLRYMSLI